jgi:hypothetical protein
MEEVESRMEQRLRVMHKTIYAMEKTVTPPTHPTGESLALKSTFPE